MCARGEAIVFTMYITHEGFKGHAVADELAERPRGTFSGFPGVLMLNGPGMAVGALQRGAQLAPYVRKPLEANDVPRVLSERHAVQCPRDAEQVPDRLAGQGRVGIPERHRRRNRMPGCGGNLARAPAITPPHPP